MVIKYLVLLSFFGVIKTRFSHYEEIDDLTGQVYLMIILDACNNSATIDIEDAEKAFTNLSLDNFPLILIPLLSGISRLCVA